MSIRRPPFLRIAVAWLVLELIAAAQVREGAQTVLTTWLTAPVRPLRQAALGIATATGDVRSGVGDTLELVRTGRRLRRERDVALARVRVLEDDLRVLRSAYSDAVAVGDLSDTALVARCLYRDLIRGILELNLGAAAGVEASLPVVAAGGVVGRVHRVSQTTSWVQLTTHPAAAVAVRSQDGRADGLISGLGNGRLQLEYVSPRLPMERGVKLETTGHEGLYPQGLPVATVQSVVDLGEPFLSITATPTVDLRSLETVLVLRSWPVSEAPQ